MIAKDQPTIFDPTKLQVVVSSKSDGNTKSNAADEDVAQTSQNIRSIAAAAGLNFQAIVGMKVGEPDQWDHIAETTSKPGHALVSFRERVICDCMVTNVVGVVLLLPVADCNAVVVHDPIKQVLAVVHLGWQSTVVELATKTVQYLQQKYRSSATDLRVYFSPAIKAESYVFEKVSQHDNPAWRPFLHKTDKGIGVDLPGYNRQRFIEAGVLIEHIEICPVNTATSDEYYSHYRSVRTGEPEGRFALLASLKG